MVTLHAINSIAAWKFRANICHTTNTFAIKFKAIDGQDPGASVHSLVFVNEKHSPQIVLALSATPTQQQHSPMPPQLR
jgi:hypothetical protein